ncbi:MAG TPA: RNA methyltransferase, partial [Anaerolineales bacterium]|nr:RNA methyltransferase [Anaerolineales bacterium]
MESITSRANPKLKQIRLLLNSHKEREQQKLFVVEGLAHVGAALQSGASVYAIYHAPSLLQSEFGNSLLSKSRAPLYELSAEAFESVSSREHGAGILAVVHTPQTQLSQLKKAQRVVAVVQPQDPGNIGSILRTLDAIGGGVLAIVDGGTDAYHPQAIRASMGAIFYQRVVRCSWQALASWAGMQGLAILGTSAKNSTDYRKVHFPEQFVLAMGAERTGLSAVQRADCTQLVGLPM